MDIFAAAGLDKPDISVLSDDFLAEVRDMPHRNLAVELLQKLLKGETVRQTPQEPGAGALFRRDAGTIPIDFFGEAADPNPLPRRLDDAKPASQAQEGLTRSVSGGKAQ